MDKELKNDLRRDDVGEALKEARSFLTRSDIMKPALAVIALVLVIAGLYYGQKFRAASAESAFARATEVYHAETGANAVPSSTGENFKTDKEKFEKAKVMFDAVASSYSSQPAGLRARYYSALCLAEMGQLKEAEEALKQVAAIKGATGIEPAMANLRVADLVLQSGRALDARNFYQALIADGTSPLPKDRLIFGLAESLAASGDKLAAKRAYTDIFNRYPQSPYAAEARQKAQALSSI